MNRYPRRLIEVDLPIRRISAHARREKSIRRGHISTLHIWWARRPLASCRAVILAALWPDPAPGPDDPPCPAPFLDAARTWMTAWATKHAEKASKESFSRLNAIQANPGILCEQPLELRNALLDFIADFANWDNSTDKDYLETSRALVQAAHESLGGLPGTRPLVVDPFAGGGSIPLEALRVGADVFASDLNPVAVLLNKVVLEYIPKYGQRLADEVRKWGEWIKKEAEKQLGEFYPKDPDGATPIAYLWARTIKCEGPGCGAEVPLMRSLWLAKRTNRSVALRVVPRPRAKRVDFKIIVKDRNGWVNQDDATDRIDDPTLDGTVKRGSATCPCCGYTTPVARLRAQLISRHGGSKDSRMIGVVTTRPGDAQRTYRLARRDDLATARAAADALPSNPSAREQGISGLPDERLDVRGIRHTWAMIYGLDRWTDYFTHRQLLGLHELTQLVRRAGEECRTSDGDGLAAAVQTCLAFAISKLADFGNAGTRWGTDDQGITAMCSRQAIPLVWDFAEANFASGDSYSWKWAVSYVQRVLEQSACIGSKASQAAQASAAAHPLPDDSANMYFTDPPYYDAVAYSFLSDFFYVWLRRSLGSVHQDLLRDRVVPKDDEIVVDRRHELSNSTHDIAFYEDALRRAFSHGRRVLRPDGIGTIVFASKTTASWEAILEAVIGAGWIVTGSWPIDTEMANRISARGQARLASSVHLACRPREDPDGVLRTDDAGDWREVLADLPRRIHSWMPRLRDEGIVGADAIFACLGPALEIFSRYSRVEKASGEVVRLREYLEYVWAAVSTEALSMIFDDADAAGLEPDARLTAMWLWTLGAGKTANGGSAAGEEEEDEEDEQATGKKPPLKGFVLEFDAARKIAMGLGVHLERSSSFVEVEGETARLLSVAERVPLLFGKGGGAGAASPPARRSKQRTLFQELETVSDAAPAGTGIGAGLTGRTTPGQTVLDRVHQAMVLFGGNRGDALKQFLVEDRVGHDARFWKLAQSLSALYPTSTEEKRWVDGVLARKKGLGF